jgi:hypothetical protein
MKWAMCLVPSMTARPATAHPEVGSAVLVVTSATVADNTL